MHCDVATGIPQRHVGRAILQRCPDEAAWREQGPSRRPGAPPSRNSWAGSTEGRWTRVPPEGGLLNLAAPPPAPGQGQLPAASDPSPAASELPSASLLAELASGAVCGVALCRGAILSLQHPSPQLPSSVPWDVFTY